MKKAVSPNISDLREIKKTISKIGYPLWNSFKQEEERYNNIILIPTNTPYAVSRKDAIKIIKDVTLRLILKAENYHIINLENHREIADLIYKVAKEWKKISFRDDIKENEILGSFESASQRVLSMLKEVDPGLTIDHLLRSSLTSLALSFSYKMREKEVLNDSWKRAANIFYNLLSELNIRKSAEILGKEMIHFYEGGEKLNEYYKRYRGEMGKIGKEVKELLYKLNENELEGLMGKYEVKKRIKSPFSAYNKLIKRIGRERVREKDFGEDEIRKKITDFIGLQFIVKNNTNLRDVSLIIINKLVKNNIQLKEIKYYDVERGDKKEREEVINYYSKHQAKITVEKKDSGYRAIHLIFEKKTDSLKSYPVEIEIMYESTYEEFKLGEYRHSKYKNEIVDKIIGILSKSSGGVEVPVYMGREEEGNLINTIFIPSSLLLKNNTQYLKYLKYYIKGSIGGLMGKEGKKIEVNFPYNLELNMAKLNGFLPYAEVLENHEKPGHYIFNLNLNGKKIR